MAIKFLDLAAINDRHASSLMSAMASVLQSGRYVLGDNVREFEREFSVYVGARYCVGVASGLDALSLVLAAWRELGRLEAGDEVLVPANTYIATLLAVSQNGLTPVLVEPEPGTLNISVTSAKAKLTPRTKVVLPVHLYGQAADVKALRNLSEEHGLLMLEDCAQSHGAMVEGRMVGSWGHAGAFSFFPSKNLGALGDAGAVVTNDDQLAHSLRVLRNYGSEVKYENLVKGVNSRLDELQAAFLRVKLKHLDSENEARRRVANRYLAGIRNPAVHLPIVRHPEGHVWHLFVVRVLDRTAFSEHLDSCGVGWLIHYPIPPHRQAAYPELSDHVLPLTEAIHKEVISLPIGPTLSDEEVEQVIEACNRYKG